MVLVATPCSSSRRQSWSAGRTCPLPVGDDPWGQAGHTTAVSKKHFRGYQEEKRDLRPVCALSIESASPLAPVNAKWTFAVGSQPGQPAA